MAFVVAGLVLVGLVIFVARALPESQVGEGAFIKRLEKFSPLLIGLVWIAYGILHFATPSNAIAQIPRYLEPWRSALSAAAGAVEIALGLLSISARWRKRVFLGQLALLVALTPFVVYLLIEDAAMAPMAGDMPLSLARLVLIFHNVLLFLWIYWAYEQASVSNGGDLTRRRRVFPDWALSPVGTVAGVMLLANVAGFAAIAGAPWYPFLGNIWAMSCLATGALVGFVFGVPRWVGPRTGENRERYLPNTNIEKVSDWLTTIVIGVSLVQFHALGPTLDSMSRLFASGAALRPGMTRSIEEAKAFASGIIVYFFVAGVIQGFLLTRMFLTRAWQADGRRG